jgi:hypothetical protein
MYPRFSPWQYQGGTLFCDAKQFARAIAPLLDPPERDPSVHYDYSLPLKARLELAQNWRAIKRDRAKLRAQVAEGFAADLLAYASS